MCGIVGIVAASEPLDPLVLQRMNDRQSHRGPDGEGFMFAAGEWGALRHSLHRRADNGVPQLPLRVGLGHRRLAILDLSDRGLQPMVSHDGMKWLVFNGEIYNHLEIKALLEAHGHAFSTRTDTEVLLSAYEEWGEACVQKLDGMFAFAIWDGGRNRLFCARDRLGIKPFYYAMPNRAFIFASEIKALLAFPGCAATAHDQAVIGFLAHGNCDYAERTLFRDIYALPAGHSLTVDAGSGAHELRRYWTLTVDGVGQGTDTEQIAQLRHSLVDAVRSHLISDVQIGSCLSGGLDSSAVVGAIGKLARENAKATTAIGERLFTFTSCYELKAFDEREYASMMADHVGAKSHLVFPAPDDFWSDFGRLAWHQDMPFGVLNFYAQWRVMRAARAAGVKVLLDGQGGDEVFGGYAKFRYAYLMSLMQKGRLGSAAGEVAAMLRRGDRYILDLRNGARYLPRWLRRMLQVDSVLQRVIARDWNSAMADEGTPATRWWHNASSRQKRSGPTLMQRIQLDDIIVDTLPQLLRMEDRSSMAFSLEARVPLLDHKIVEMGVALPDNLKVRNGWSKYAVRQAGSDLMPDTVRFRKTKLGFAAPDRAWIGDKLRQPIHELLNSELRAARYIDVAKLRKWHGSDASLSANAESLNGLFRILSLEMWMRAFSLS